MKKNLKINLQALTFKTFLRSFLLISFFVTIVIAVVIYKGSFRVRLREGDISLKFIYAPHDFMYAGPPDMTATERQRQKAKKAVKDIYALDPQVLPAALKKIDVFFRQVSSAKDETIVAGEDPKQRLKTKIFETADVSLSENSLNAFLKIDDTRRLASDTKDIMSGIYSRGILLDTDKKRLKGAGEKDLMVLDTASRTESSVEIAKIPGYDEAIHDILADTRKILPDKKTALAVSELLENLIAPNLFFEMGMTKEKRRAAAEAVPIQYQQVEIKKGQLVIAKGQRVTKEHIAQLVKLEKSESRTGRIKFLIGIFFLVCILLFIVTLYFVLYEPKIFHTTSYLVLIGTLSVFVLFVAHAIIISPVPSYFIPLAGVSMLLAILLNPRMAIFITVCLSIAVGINVENSLNLMIIFLFGGLVGIFSTANIRHRWHIIRSGVLVGLTNCMAIIAIGLLNNFNFDSFMTDGIYGFANGIICAFIVMGLLPLLEGSFKLTTNITLLELSDMNHPLLKQMILKAPGTYHHSLIVGNLAETAAEAIGVNSLLAKIGAYYHDVGKIEKAEYFSENQTNAKSLHDKLTPSMSRLVIASHVKDGVELGIKHKLRKPILDFIEQHHGTGLIYYFFQKALERIEDETLLKEEGFRYQGPKPQTKETAIVLLADSVEAASRALANNPTPSRVEELVHRIINNKFIDGQLDECELTLKDLNKIAEVFIRILMGSLHTRVEYPLEGKTLK